MTSPTWHERWRELEKGATKGPWKEDYGTEPVGNGARAFAVGPVHPTRYFHGKPTREELDRAVVGVHKAQADAKLITFLRNTAAEVAWVVEAAQQVNRRRIQHGRDASAENELFDALGALDRRVKELEG